MLSEGFPISLQGWQQSVPSMEISSQAAQPALTAPQSLEAVNILDSLPACSATLQIQGMLLS